MGKETRRKRRRVMEVMSQAVLKLRMKTWLLKRFEAGPHLPKLTKGQRRSGVIAMRGGIDNQSPTEALI
jgi:hypothetical protein